MMYSTYQQLILLCTIATLATCTSFNLTIIPFDEAFSPLYGNQNIAPSDDGKSVQISMDQWSTSGSGFVSRYMYNHGLFTASIKLPNNTYSAGVVATFYLQNNELMRDEIDFEFLGHIEGEKWILQTNVYGNGSIHRGREERYTLPFDPSKDFHYYSILWNTGRVIFLVDEWPIREVKNVKGMGGDFPSKPMYVYGTIWDGSNWATHQGEYRVDLRYGPFVTGYSFIINGCCVDPFESTPSGCDVGIPSGVLSLYDRQKMNWYRTWCMTYSYCDDTGRYPNSLPECGVEGPGMQPDPVSKASGRFIWSSDFTFNNMLLIACYHR